MAQAYTQLSPEHSVHPPKVLRYGSLVSRSVSGASPALANSGYALPMISKLSSRPLVDVFHSSGVTMPVRRQPGPGLGQSRVPEAMWAEVVEVAQVEGVEATARALRLDRARLAARMTAARAAAGGEPAAEVGGGFVELDVRRLDCRRS